MDTYWGKIKRVSQHQLEEVLDWAAYLEHLLAVFREFDPTATPNEEIMIWYFREDLRPSIRAQLDAQGRDLDFWEKAVKKTVNVEAKTMLQSSSNTRDMDSRYPQENRKKDKKDFGGKNKSTNFPSANISSGKQSSSTQQTSSVNSKKDQDHQQSFLYRRRRGHGRDSPGTGVNIVLKKEERDMSQVKYYYCHQKGHYSNKCPWNSKEESKN